MSNKSRGVISCAGSDSLSGNVLLSRRDNAASIEQIMAEGFDLVAMGRVLIAEQDYINKLASGVSTNSICTACNRGVAMMYTPGGTSCVLGKPGDPELNRQRAADR